MKIKCIKQIPIKNRLKKPFMKTNQLLNQLPLKMSLNNFKEVDPTLMWKEKEIKLNNHHHQLRLSQVEQLSLLMYAIKEDLALEKIRQQEEILSLLNRENLEVVKNCGLGASQQH